MMNYHLGDIVSAKELGRKDNSRHYIYMACVQCGTPRWVQMRGNKPQNQMCAKCALQSNKPKHDHETSVCTVNPAGSHWWMIEPQNGETSGARCKYCGVAKTFYNALHDLNESQVTIAPHDPNVGVYFTARLAAGRSNPNVKF